jgi:hypothetical protein
MLDILSCRKAVVMVSGKRLGDFADVMVSDIKRVRRLIKYTFVDMSKGQVCGWHDVENTGKSIEDKVELFGDEVDEIHLHFGCGWLNGCQNL